MKKLEELGISPAPWKHCVNTFGMGENIIWDANNKRVAGSGIDSCFSFDNQTANHNMQVAAPELYDALQRIVQASDDSVHDFPSWQKNLFTALIDARSALAKAAGEEVANG